jgi:hypothetical protein
MHICFHKQTLALGQERKASLRVYINGNEFVSGKEITNVYSIMCGVIKVHFICFFQVIVTVLLVKLDTELKFRRLYKMWIKFIPNRKKRHANLIL